MARPFSIEAAGGGLKTGKHINVSWLWFDEGKGVREIKAAIYSRGSKVANLQVEDEDHPKLPLFSR